MTARLRIAVIVAQPEPLSGWLRPLLTNVEVAVGATPADLAHALPAADAIFVWGHPSEPFGNYVDLAPRVRWVHASGAGIDSLLVPQLIERRIKLTNSRGLYSSAVAELAVTLLLALAKQLPGRIRAQDQREWRQELSRKLNGATLVVVGLGSVGTAVARAARGLEMHVIGVRRKPRPSRFADLVVGLQELGAALAAAEYVVLCCPDTPETRGLIGHEELALLPQGALLINVARGSVVDEVALIAALQSGHLGGAGLDVFEHEPLPLENPLWTLENVIVSPHYPNTRGFEQDTLRLFHENLERFANGRRLKNVVNKRRGY